MPKPSHNQFARMVDSYLAAQQELLKYEVAPQFAARQEIEFLLAQKEAARKAILQELAVGEAARHK